MDSLTTTVDEGATTGFAGVQHWAYETESPFLPVNEIATLPGLAPEGDQQANARWMADLQEAPAYDVRFEGEVDRRSPAYTRWVQTSLNQVASAGLTVDGQLDRRSRAAVASFQVSRNLVPDGAMGPKTEAALVAAGAPAPPGANAPAAQTIPMIPAGGSTQGSTLPATAQVVVRGTCVEVPPLPGADVACAGVDSTQFARIPEVATFAARLSDCYADRMAAQRQRERHVKARADVTKRAAALRVPGETRTARNQRIAAASAAVQPEPLATVRADIRAKYLTFLEEDFRDTIIGANNRWGAKCRLRRVSRQWMFGVRERVDYVTLGTGGRSLGAFTPPAVPAGGDRLVAIEPPAKTDNGARVQPIMNTFLRELRARAASHSAYNYPSHGGGSFNGRGFSIDLELRGGTDDRGFYPPANAVQFLLAIDAAARAAGVQWRAIYNDHSVASAVNRQLDRKHVIFVGHIRRGTRLGLNWHGPLILHVHLDIVPIEPPATQPAAQHETEYHGSREDQLFDDEENYEDPGEYEELDKYEDRDQRDGVDLEEFEDQEDYENEGLDEDELEDLDEDESEDEDLEEYEEEEQDLDEFEYEDEGLDEYQAVEPGAGAPAHGSAEAAVENFQSYLGIETGAMKRVADGAMGVVAFLVSPNLVRGSTGQAVAALQRGLTSLGFPVKDTGTYDAATEQAVRSFQAWRSISPATGKVGPTTKKRLVYALSFGSRIRTVMALLVDSYHFPVNGAAGLVGNLMEESDVLPNRVEGANNPEAPMHAKDARGVFRTFTPAEVRDRVANTKMKGVVTKFGNGPLFPGIGLAQWSKPARRRGLFAHAFGGRVLGVDILGNLPGQVDYLVTELRSSYPRIHRLITRAGVSVDDAADEVVYNFEIPGSILQTVSGRTRKLPRSDAAVAAVFLCRRAHANRALLIYQAAHPGP